MKDTQELKEHEWYLEVRSVLEKHPDWLTTTQQATTAGIKDRLGSELNARAQAEAALVICYDSNPTIPGHQRETVINAIKGSKLVGGTKYAEELK